ncbi:MAG: hypothetical protein WC750_01330 [Patescibacteria group bacterium]
MSLPVIIDKKQKDGYFCEQEDKEMHLTQIVTKPLPPARHPATGNEFHYSEWQTSNGLLLYSVEGLHPHVALHKWECATAGQVVFLTSLFKLMWGGADQAVYVDRKRHPDNEHDVDLFMIGDAGKRVVDRWGVHLNVVMPEKMCLMPPVTAANGTVVPSVIHAAQDQYGVSYIFNGLKPVPIVRDLKHLEDFWVNMGRLWVMTRGEMHSLSEPVKRRLRIYRPNGGLEKEVELSCVACGRPVFVKDKLVFPVQRWSNGPWELTTGNECLWRGVDISNLYAYQEGVLCLVSDESGLWRVMRGLSFSSGRHPGELVKDVTMWPGGKLSSHMRIDNAHEYVVYDDQRYGTLGKIDHKMIILFKGQPVYPVKLTDDGGWCVAWGHEIISQPCQKVLEIESVQNKEGALLVCSIKDGSFVTELYEV